MGSTAYAIVLLNIVLLSALISIAVLEYDNWVLSSSVPSLFWNRISEFASSKYSRATPSLRRLQSEHSDHILAREPGHVFNHTSSHKKAWMHMYEVNGLKNEEVVMVVTSTVTKEGYYLRERIIASSRTWMRMFANTIVVIEDTFEIRFAMRNCDMVDYAEYTTFTCHNEPTYLLSRKCTSAYYGADGPCCKVDDAINFIVNVRPDFFKQIKFMLHCDDDMYWRADQVFRWLASVENSGANKYPIISNLGVGDEGNHGVWMIRNCQEVQTTGWYQPAMLNHALLVKMAAGAAAYGVRDTCKHFDVTHDIGLGVFAWMYGANHIQMPQTFTNGDHRGIGVFQPTDMAMHCVRHHSSERCDGRADNGWKPEDMHNQNMVTGCGDLDHPIEGHDRNKNADMYDAWHFYKKNGLDIVLDTENINEYTKFFVVVDRTGKVVHILQQSAKFEPVADGTFTASEVELIDGTRHVLSDGETLTQRVVPRLMPLSGYSSTQHSRDNDVTKVWKPFTLADCQPPGEKDH